MANLCTAALDQIRGYLLAPDGLRQRAYQLAERDKARPPMIMPRQVVLRHAARELSDAVSDVVYPAVFLYCTRLENRLERKFTAFSGRVFAVAEIRVSGERAEDLDGELDRLVEATLDILSDQRGQWTPEICFDGRLEVRFEPLALGGRHFVRTAAIELELLAHG